jgi:UDP-N-acetylmuramoyl-L-alanyl-D-glutamate--2,6-diaminopimelate ligase
MNRLNELLPHSSTIKNIHGPMNTPVKGLSADSREIRNGFLFFAIQGQQADGNEFISTAVANGASVIVSENPRSEYLTCPYVQVTDIYKAMAQIAVQFYKTENSDLKFIGVTGTNGKTTTAFFINELLKSFSQKTVFISTIGIEICGTQFHTDYTTPPAYELHRFLREGMDSGARFVVMEVSSHALKYKRVLGLSYDLALFTNLTYEHREIHPTMEDYFDAKLQLFSQLKADGHALINADDPYGKQILEKFAANRYFHDYGFSAQYARMLEIDVRAEDHNQLIRYRRDGAVHEFTLPMIGEYNACNALAALEALQLLGFDEARTIALFRDIPTPDGRFEWLRLKGFSVIIDFAHTPDGIEKLLNAVKGINNQNGRILTIFGCPGSRDATKRPLMGEAAVRLSDHVIVTTDDIHYEVPESIINDITKGLTQDNFEVILERRDAIRKGLQLAQPGDFVVIAGRGHEQFQYVRDRKIPFVDKDVVREEAKKMGLE